MLMDSFEVENFRSLKHLKLEKLARVNLLVGKGNVGKTSVLEGLWALIAIRGTDWLAVLEKERGIEKNKSDFRHLFYGFNAANPVKFTATYTTFTTGVPNEHEQLSVGFELPSRVPYANSNGNYSGQFASTLKRDGSDVMLVNVQLSAAAPNLGFTLHRLNDEGLALLPTSTEAGNFLGAQQMSFTRNRRVELITTTIDRSFLSQKIESIKVGKGETPLIRTLQLVDSRIQKIELVSGGQIYLDLGEQFSTLMPLNLLGEGIQRLLDVSSGIAAAAGGSVLIDEIDNGLHYSALRILWKGILQAAREYDVQIVATTHSAEALRHLTWVLNEEENASYRDDVAAYTLIRTKDDTVRSYRYNYEQLEFAMEQDIEVRN